MAKLGDLIGLFRVPADKPDLAESQLRAFAKQIPLLYLILLANTLFVSATHYAVAPVTLTVALPSGFALICAVRLIGWWRMRHVTCDHLQAVQRLRSTVRLVGIFSIAFVAWGFAMYPYGEAFHKAHVVFYMSITTVACVFCLMHVRAAALALILVAIGPTTAFFATRGEPVLAAIAGNNLLVAFAMMFILFTHYRDFAQMISQQGELRRRQQETQQLSDENFRLANRDSLTGMPNRRSFFAAIRQRLAEQSNTAFAVGLIDLDGFKAVNDLYGHAAGDELLVEAARRMESLQSSEVSFARLGGDEFGVILTGCTSSERMLAMGHELCSLLRLPYVLTGLTVEISASAGVAVFPEAGSTSELLVEHADYALYQAKQQRSGTAIIFSGNHAHDIRRLNLIDQTLRNADLEAELRLDYQPIFEPATGRIVAFEALARWSNPMLGNVPPSLFIKAAERSDLINRLTIALYRRALFEAASWPDEIGLSFNLSARTIASPATVLALTAATVNGGVKASRIDFEVTETAVMADFDQAVQTLTALRATGARIALDDFGSGYSSLGYVHRLPLDKIKIDSGFIADTETNETVRNIVKTIVDLSRNLGLACVAEGIETARQAEIVRDLGCGLVQGYYFGHPGRPENFLARSTAAEPWLPALTG